MRRHRVSSPEDNEPNLSNASLGVLYFSAARLFPSEDLFFLHDDSGGHDFHWRPEEFCPQGDDVVAIAELEISFSTWIEQKRTRRAEERARELVTGSKSSKREYK